MRPKVIAEIGCNHKGNMDIAKEMIITAKIFCKVDIVKFQKRNPKELLSEKEYKIPHPVKSKSYGNTYGQHREFLELSLEDHIELKKTNPHYYSGLDINFEKLLEAWSSTSPIDFFYNTVFGMSYAEKMRISEIELAEKKATEGLGV